MFYVPSVAVVIDPDDTATETEEFGLHGRVVGHQDRGTVKYVIPSFDVLDADLSALGLPEFSNSEVSWMIVPDDVPPISPPPDDSIEHCLKVVREGRGRFWYSGELCIPVERDGHRSWLYLVPQPAVPIVHSWRSNGEGGLVRVPDTPTIGHFLVRTDEGESLAVLLAAAVERGDRSGDADVRLPCPVFDIDVRRIGVSVHVTESGQQERVLPTTEAGTPVVGTSVLIRECSPDRE